MSEHIILLNDKNIDEEDLKRIFKIIELNILKKWKRSTTRDTSKYYVKKEDDDIVPTIKTEG